MLGTRSSEKNASRDGVIDKRSREEIVREVVGW